MAAGKERAIKNPALTTTTMAFLSIPLPIVQLSLAAVLKCGQSFRWSVLTPADSITPVEYRLCLKDRVVCLRQSSDTLFYRSVFPDPQPPLHDHTEREAETLAWLRDYFQLDIDLVALYKQWAESDPVFAKVQERFEGIRMLRQDPWENLISFVLPLILVPAWFTNSLTQIYMLF